MKTLNTESAEPKKGIVRVGDDSRAKRDRYKLDGSEINDGEIDGGKVGRDKIKKNG